jgi:hypothetical protein
MDIRFRHEGMNDRWWGMSKMNEKQINILQNKAWDETNNIKDNTYNRIKLGDEILKQWDRSELRL